MIEGTLIAESLRVGTALPDLELVIRKISRYRAQGSTPDQPEIWTTLTLPPRRPERTSSRRRSPVLSTSPAGMWTSTLLRRAS